MTTSDNAKSDVSADIAIKLDNINRQIVENDVSSEEYDDEALQFANITMLAVAAIAMSFIVIVGLATS